MLNATDKSVFISVMRYFFTYTKISYDSYQDMLTHWDRYSTQQSENYTYWLFARCLETLNSRAIPAFDTCLAYSTALRLYLYNLDDCKPSSIASDWLSQARAYLSSQCPNPEAICDLGDLTQLLYPSLPTLTRDDMLQPIYMNTRIIITAPSNLDDLQLLTEIANKQPKADIYVLLYGFSDWIIAEGNSLAEAATAYNKQYRYLSGFSTDSNVLFTIFRLDHNHQDKNNFILDKLELSNRDVLVMGKRLIRKSRMPLLRWQVDRTTTQMRTCPMLVSQSKASSELSQEPEGTLAHTVLSSQMFRDAAWYTYPLVGHETIAITAHNYWESVVSHGIRSVLSYMSNFRLDISSIQAPDESLPEYRIFKADSLALMLFGYNALGYSYRNLQAGNIKYTRNNKFFPLPIQDCKKLITDSKLLDDLESNPCDNSITTQALSWAVKNMSKEGLELTQFCSTKLLSSLMGTTRAAIGYKNGLEAYDAGLAQIRAVPELWSSRDNEQYTRLVSQLRSKMTGLIYIIDSSEV